MVASAGHTGESSLPGKGSSDTFQALKSICVPLLSNSLLKPETIPRASGLLSQLSSLLQLIQEKETTILPASIEYVFFPISQILQRNPISVIPDVVMEPLMVVISVLFRQWWWFCQTDVWEQMLMLSAAIFCGIGSNTDPKGKGKDRDEETKRATAQCLWTILRRRNEVDFAVSERTASRAEERFAFFRDRAQAPKILPILGQTLTSLLETSQSANHELQIVSFHLILTLIADYFPDTFIPSILPGVVSAMTKVALGRSEGKGWSKGDIVDLSLNVIQITILSAIRDEICEAEGALRNVTSLEDIGDAFELDRKPRPVNPTPPPSSSPFTTLRTSVWLSATASQLHIALNTLSPLLSHPNPVALLALSQFSYRLLSSTTRSLPDSQPLLFSYLLSLSKNRLPEVADASHACLLSLLVPPSPSRFTLLQVLSRLMRDNLTSLPRVISSQSDAKVEHIARQISAACELSGGIPTVSEGIRKLLGPTGGIEKWGWNILSVLEFTVPPIFISTTQPAHSLLEASPDNPMNHPFPEVNMKFVSSQSTRETMEGMFRAFGSAAGTDSLFTVEWFMNVARRGKNASEVAALWCVGRILEGLSDVSLDNTNILSQSVPTRVEKVAKWVAKVVSEFWDQDEQENPQPTKSRPVETPESDGHLPLEYIKGLNPLITRFDLDNHEKTTQSTPSHVILHKVLSLQLLSITSAVLRSRFMRLLLHTLYPILHSIVSQDAYLSSTALAALYYVTAATGYASPSNLLLANFDYALDGVARRLDRRHLDPEATKILVVLVRLVGKDVVLRAGDVVEACFDRLDEFHGYEALVDGLIEVLAEVVEAVAAVDDANNGSPGTDRSDSRTFEDRIQLFLEWYQHRNDGIEGGEEGYGPAPRQAWGELAGKGKEKAVDGNDMAENANPVSSEETPALTSAQVLTQQIVSHSIYFLTHSSPTIRARILGLLNTASPTLADSSLLPSIHSAWPYILNRLEDPEPFVVSAAASLIASLAEHVGEFMASRIWEGIWPRFRAMLSKLEQVDSHSALSRRGYGAVGTESAYSHSHRLYKSLLKTMRAVVKGSQLRHDVLWELVIAFRRFLHKGAHIELQFCARDLYVSLMEENGDVVWLVLSATIGKDVTGQSSPDISLIEYLRESKWDIEENAKIILGTS